jgi:hypothetical protein
MQYQTASEVDHMRKLFSRPIPIVAACNRVAAQGKRSNRLAWFRGVFWGLGSVGAVFLVVWMVS